VLGLHSGADDYMTKPFGVSELVTRVDVITRRRTQGGNRPANSRASAPLPGLVVDVPRRQAIVRGRPVDLTRQEFDVLRLLATHRGVVFSRASIIARVWRRESCATGRSVDSVISRLRAKVERDPCRPEWILTVRDGGYKCADAG
jgi:DNA-binding response OmpR family regulator